MISPQLLLLSAACLSSVSASRYDDYYSDYETNMRAVTYVSIAMVITFAFGIWVAFWGLKYMRASFFLSTLAVGAMISKFIGTIDNFVVGIVLIVLGIIVAWVKPLYKVGIFLLGMSIGAVIISFAIVVLIVVLLRTLVYYEDSVVTLDILCAIAAVILSIYFGIRALKLEPTFLRIATSLLGGYTAATSFTLLVAINTYFVTLTGLAAMIGFGCALIFVLGMNMQKLEWYKNPFIVEGEDNPSTVQTTTPPPSQEPYVSAA